MTTGIDEFMFIYRRELQYIGRSKCGQAKTAEKGAGAPVPVRWLGRRGRPILGDIDEDVQSREDDSTMKEPVTGKVDYPSFWLGVGWGTGVMVLGLLSWALLNMRWQR